MPAYGYEFYLLVVNSISHSFAALTREISSWPLEDKIHIHARACNILYICLLFQIRCKAVEWHPDVATQMVLASEDDRYPVIQVCSNFNAIKLILDAVLKMQFSNKHYFIQRSEISSVFYLLLFPCSSCGSGLLSRGQLVTAQCRYL